MKKQFLLLTMLLSMALSACSYKSTKEIDSELGKESPSFSPIYSEETNRGEKYIITECKYMHPLSSKSISIEHCTEYYYISEDSFFIERGSDVPEGQANSEEYGFIHWGWQEFPYTDAEWNALYSMEDFGAQTDLLANHDEVLYQPLMLGYSILKVDGELWLVDMNDINGEQAIWSIYVIEPEKEGVKLPGESITESLNLSDYLAQHATDTFEGDYVKLDAVEGLSYVYNENVSDSGEVSGSFVTIYNQGIHCGRFEIIELPEGGLQTERQFIQFHAWRSSHGSVEQQSQETIEGVVRYTFLVSELPYTYGDTEWLIEAGLFTDENEACKESCEYVDVLWSKEGANKGYCFSVNKALLSEKALAQLTEAVSFKEGAFEPSNMEKALSATGGVPYFKEEYRELITPENASRLAYEIVFGEETYHVPEHTFALRVDENKWEIYCYTMDGTGGRLIGSIALSDDGSNKLEVNIMDNENPDAEMNVNIGVSESDDASINENDKFQFNKIEILDANGKLIAEDGGWYIVSGDIKLQICYKGAPEVVSVFYIPTGTQMLSKREQLAVYSLYEEGAKGIEFQASDKEEEGKTIVIDVPLEKISGTGHIYVMLENEEKGIFSEHYNVSIE